MKEPEAFLATLRLLWLPLFLLVANVAGTPPSSDVFIVHTSLPSVILYEGDLPGYLATAIPVARAPTSSSNPPSSVDAAGIGDVIRPRRPDAAAAHVRSYIQYLESQHFDIAKAAFVARDKIFYSYTYTVSAFAARLTPLQVRRLQHHPLVAHVEADATWRVHTTYSPSFLNLPNVVWPVLPAKNPGKGIVIGVIDSGIWPEHPSFFTGSGISVRIPTGWRGKCNSTSDFPASLCSGGKIVGTGVFNRGYLLQGNTISGSKEYLSARDTSGHGTWCASAAAGFQNVPVTAGSYQFGNASGTAPGASLAIYKVVWGGDTATQSDIYAAIERAVTDGVDVISMSLGSAFNSYFRDLPLLSAARVGVVAALSAGNNGPAEKLPYYASLQNAAPYYITVGASTMDRRYIAQLTLGSGTVIAGVSFGIPPTTSAAAFTNLPIFSAFSYSDVSNLCLFFGSQSVSGKIVVCQWAANVSTDQVSPAQQAGAAAIVLVPPPPAAPGSGGDPPLQPILGAIPVILLTQAQNATLGEYIGSTGSPTANLSGGITEIGKVEAPAVASFSSTGPIVDPSALSSLRRLSNGILKPDVLAPGSTVWGAFPGSKIGTQGTFAALQGTSMAAPHVAGICALLLQLHGFWTPAQVKSAIMTTAKVMTNKGNQIPSDTGAVTTPWSYGSGEVDGTLLLQAGLTFDVSHNEYVRFLLGISPVTTRLLFHRQIRNPAKSWTLRLRGKKRRHARRRNRLTKKLQALIKPIPAHELNLPSIVVAKSFMPVVLVKRVAYNVAYYPTMYTAKLEVPIPDVWVRVIPSHFLARPLGSITLRVMFVPLLKARDGAFRFGRILLVDGTGHRVRMTVGIQAMNMVTVIKEANFTGTG